MRLRHEERFSSAKASQEVTLMEKSFSEAFKVSLKRFFLITYRTSAMDRFSVELLWDAVV